MLRLGPSGHCHVWLATPLAAHLHSDKVDQLPRLYFVKHIRADCSCELHFAALKRILDRREPDYAS